MCGIVGMAGGLDYKDEDAMKRMMMMNWFRGKASTGLASIKPSKETKIVKNTLGPWDLFEYPDFKTALNGAQSCIWIGHARAPTRGETNKFNAHPFQFDHIVGCHNGTLHGTSHSDLEKALDTKFPVDSMAIIAAIAAFGIEETVKYLEGSWALVWADLEKGTINFLRNKDRPLWFSMTDDAKVLYWASEWPMIQAGSNGGYRELARDKKQGFKFFPFIEDIHYSYAVSKLMKGEAQKPVIKKMEGKEPFLAPSKSSGEPSSRVSDPFKRREHLMNRSSTTTSLGTPTKMITRAEGTEDNPYAGAVQRSEFEHWSQDGCALCHTPVRWGDRGITIFEKEGLVLCKKHSSCGETDNTRVYVKEMQ